MPIAFGSCVDWIEYSGTYAVTRLPDKADSQCFVELSKGQTTSGPAYAIRSDDPDAYQEITGLTRLGEFGSYGYVDLNRDGYEDTVVSFTTPAEQIQTSIYITDPDDPKHPWVTVISDAVETLPDFHGLASSGSFVLGPYGCPSRRITITGNPPQVSWTDIENAATDNPSCAS